jgi:hypothetical protein
MERTVEGVDDLGKLTRGRETAAFTLALFRFTGLQQTDCLINV